MLYRIKALTTVGQYVGINEMIGQIKDEEVRDILNWLRLGYANTHGCNQSEEGKIWERRSEIKQLGCGNNVVDALYNYCFDKVCR